MIVNFKEIPKANSGVGNQDTFELFARDFLQSIGYKILSNPGRGADGGIDIKIQETRNGINGQKTHIDWLVSCKHYAHTGKSISTEIEKDILDRVHANKCHGFIGFYSTLPSESLNKKLGGLSKQIPFQVFDSKQIESLLISFKTKEELFIRYFPESYKIWKELYYFKEPIKLFDYYISKELEYDIDIFQNIFGSNEQILKALRASNNFSNFLKKSHVKVICDSNLTKDLNKVAKENSAELQGLKFTEITGKIHDDYLPRHLSMKHDIYFDPKALIFAVSFHDPKETGYTLLYDNVLFINNPVYNKMMEIYDKLIKILE